MARLLLVMIPLVLLLTYSAYIRWCYHSDNACEDEIEELKNTIKRWEGQANRLLGERTKLEQELAEIEENLYSKRGRYMRKNEKTKKDIMEEHKAEILKMRTQGFTRVEIAKYFDTSEATVGRALRKWGETKKK